MRSNTIEKPLKKTWTPWNKDLARKGKKLRALGYTHKQIAKELGVCAATVNKYSIAEQWPSGNIQSDKKARQLAERKAIDDVREIVRERLVGDLEASLDALDVNHPLDCESLGDLLTRERIAELVQKRASSLLDLGEKDQAIVNIAILSNLPDAVTD